MTQACPEEFTIRLRQMLQKILWTGKGGRGDAGRLKRGFSERGECLQNKKQVTKGQAQGSDKQQ